MALKQDNPKTCQNIGSGQGPAYHYWGQTGLPRRLPFWTTVWTSSKRKVVCVRRLQAYYKRALSVRYGIEFEAVLQNNYGL